MQTPIENRKYTSTVLRKIWGEMSVILKSQNNSRSRFTYPFPWFTESLSRNTNYTFLRIAKYLSWSTYTFPWINKSFPRIVKSLSWIINTFSWIFCFLVIRGNNFIGHPRDRTGNPRKRFIICGNGLVIHDNDAVYCESDLVICRNGLVIRRNGVVILWKGLCK